MSSHIGHSHGGYASGLIDAIAHDIADLISDVLKLLGGCGCHPPGCHPPCYCPGTMILTTKGEIAVEALSVGDLVVTASGSNRPIRWIGQRRIDIARHPEPASIKPVCIKAGAFGSDMPQRDLFVSPGHSIFVENALIPVQFLLNGTTLAQVQDAKTVTYVHIELDQHDVILAEGLPAESYLDTGNRSDFENNGRLVTLHPTFTSKDWADTCAPLVKSGATVENVKRRLLQRAEGFGHRVTEDHDLHILVDGQRIDPVRDGAILRFDLPEGSSDLRLASRSWVPAYLSPGSQDDRELGVCVARMTIDEADVVLSSMTAGWHGFDVSGGTSYRWTTGLAALPKARSVTIELCGTALYWVPAASRDIALINEAA